MRLTPQPNLEALRRLLVLLTLAGSLWTAARAQDDAITERLLGAGIDDAPDHAFATFKANRLINGHSVEQMRARHLLFLIQHRFSTIEEGWYDLFGFDGAQIRIGLDYGLTDWLTVGAGRNSYQKSYDGYAKLRLLRQASGPRPMPLTLNVVAASAVQTLRRPPDPEGRTLPDRARLYYSWQLLAARKWSEWFSTQLSPTVVHRNLVRTAAERNTIFSLGLGGRFKFSKRAALLAEYFWVPDEHLIRSGPRRHFNALALGFDIETGGHVFQLHFTNATGMMERAFVGETTSDFFAGQIRFGFNIHRTFSFAK